MQKDIRSNQGFTLVEVLVAIAVVGFTIPALISLMMTQTDNAGSLRNRSIAMWIAEDTLTRLRLERKLNNSSLRSVTEETVTMAGTQWRVVTSPEETELGALLRYRTVVSLGDDNVLATLDTFIH